MSTPHVVILGGGPAGVGGAFELRRRDKASVTLLEQGPVAGGNAGSFELEGLRVDYGSHRLHPATEPHIMADIRELLGSDLLDRPRHGRIRLRGRWIHFPLKPIDLFLRLDPAFALGSAADAAGKALGLGRDGAAARDGGENFASVLRASLGPTIYDNFYAPYAVKLWGKRPEELSAIQARRRVSAASFAKLVRKVLSAVPGLKPPGAGRFFYPRRGFGQISEAYGEAARKNGAEMLFGWRASELEYDAARRKWTVTAERREHPSASGGQPAESRRIEADYVWSTLPISLLARMVRPAAPTEVLAAAGRIDYRAMLLVYLVLDVDQFTEYDAHYFPGADVAITRLSEPKNYPGLTEPRGRTVLCAELPCAVGDKYWEMSDADLGKLVADDLARSGIPLRRPAVGVHVRRLRQAYPIYTTGYEEPLGVLDRWAEGLPRALSYGRQGLFAHDNTHHALFMAYSAADCLTNGEFDEAKWRAYRKVFETHVVED